MALTLHFLSLLVCACHRALAASSAGFVGIQYETTQRRYPLRSQTSLHITPSGTGPKVIAAPLFPERLNIIYDSKCSVCQWEVDDLRSRMASLPPPADGTPLLRFTDLESPDGYNEEDRANGGVTYEQAMRSFHAVKPDGTVLHGISVFREAYEIVDLGWVWAWTSNRLFRGVADFGYKAFAAIRTDVTRGARVESLIEQHYGGNGAASSVEGGEGDCIPCREDRSSS